MDAKQQGEQAPSATGTLEEWKRKLRFKQLPGTSTVENLIKSLLTASGDREREDGSGRDVDNLIWAATLLTSRRRLRDHQEGNASWCSGRERDSCAASWCTSHHATPTPTARRHIRLSCGKSSATASQHACARSLPPDRQREGEAWRRQSAQGRAQSRYTRRSHSNCAVALRKLDAASCFNMGQRCVSQTAST